MVLADSAGMIGAAILGGLVVVAALIFGYIYLIRWVFKVNRIVTLLESIDARLRFQQTPGGDGPIVIPQPKAAEGTAQPQA